MKDNGAGAGQTTDAKGEPDVNTDAKVANTWDQVTNDRIRLLDSAVQQPATDFINAAESELGLKVRITSGYRTRHEQDSLYAIGREKGDKRSTVTNAKGGQSNHESGLAIDVVPMVGGTQPDWGSPHWKSLGELGEKYGFKWGGRWIEDPDRPHFEWPRKEE